MRSMKQAVNLGTGNRQTIEKRFENLYEPEPTSGCWIWTSILGKAGYGLFWLDGRFTNAHRVSYLLKHGSIPDGKELDHLCRVRCCVNPQHLEPVSHKENVR